MTHRDGFPRFSARSAWRGDAGHRKARATPSESLGKPPFRSPGRTAGGCRKALPMSHIARGFPPTRRIAHAISNSPLKKAPLTGFHPTAKHNVAKAVSPSSETMRTI